MTECFITAPKELIKTGAKLYWLYTQPGGYGWSQLVKCEVLRTFPSGRVKIRIWQKPHHNFKEWTETERVVLPEKLRCRADGSPVWETL